MLHVTEVDLPAFEAVGARALLVAADELAFAVEHLFLDSPSHRNLHIEIILIIFIVVVVFVVDRLLMSAYFVLFKQGQIAYAVLLVELVVVAFGEPLLPRVGRLIVVPDEAHLLSDHVNVGLVLRAKSMITIVRLL